VRFVLAFIVAIVTFDSAFAAPVSAQRAAWHVDIAVNPATALTEGPTITSDNLLADAKTREHLRNGFPARIHYRLELWKKGVFDDLDGRAQWDVLVAYDPTAQQYLVRRTSDQNVTENFGGFATLTSAEAQFGKAYRVGLHPTRGGRYYYNLVIEIQTLTESDLDLLQQWLHGSSAPGKSNNPLISLRSGLVTLLSRVLGGGTERREVQSGIFQVP
jgi:hypothetical protein